jgi:hypothetical protein
MEPSEHASLDMTKVIAYSLHAVLICQEEFRKDTKSIGYPSPSPIAVTQIE